MLQTLRSSSRVMLGLVEEVLDFSKIEAGKLVLERTDFDLHALVNSTCRILSSQAAAKGVEFVVSIMPEVPPAVRGDAHHLRQVLINLAGNAVKFTERGSVTVHVSSQGETEAGVRLKFSVRDTGIGIAPEAQKQDLRELHAGRPDHHAPLRRHGPGHHHRQAAGRADGRQDRPGKRGRPGQHVLVRSGVREAARARRRGRRASSPARASCWSVSRASSARRSSSRSRAGAPSPVAVAQRRRRRDAAGGGDQPRQALSQRAAVFGGQGPAARAALPARGARSGAADRAGGAARARTCRASPRCRRASARCSRCRSTSGSCSTCCTRSRRARKRAKAWCGCRTTRGAARAPRGCTCWSPTTIPTNREVLSADPGARRPYARRWSPTASARSTRSKADHFDIALIDRNMPRLCGIETVQAIRLIDRRARAPAGGDAVGRRHAGGRSASASKRAPTPSSPSRSRRRGCWTSCSTLCGAQGAGSRARRSRSAAARRRAPAPAGGRRR